MISSVLLVSNVLSAVNDGVVCVFVVVYAYRGLYYNGRRLRDKLGNFDAYSITLIYLSVTVNRQGTQYWPRL